MWRVGLSGDGLEKRAGVQVRLPGPMVDRFAAQKGERLDNAEEVAWLQATERRWRRFWVVGGRGWRWMDARSVWGVGFDEDAIARQPARERSALMGGQCQGAAEREKEVAFEEGARLFEAAAEGVEKAPGMGDGGDEIEEGVVGAHAVQDNGQAAVRGDGDLRGDKCALAPEGDTVRDSSVEAAFAEGVEMVAVTGDELFEAVEVGLIVAFVQVDKRDRMDADADEHPWAAGQIERSPPVVRSHGTDAKSVDTRAMRSLEDRRAISVERGQLQMAVGVEHGVAPPKIAGVLPPERLQRLKTRFSRRPSQRRGSPWSWPAGRS